SEFFKVTENNQFGFQLGDGLCCRCTVNDLLFGIFQLGTPRLVEVAVLVIIEYRRKLVLLLQSATAGDDPLLRKPRLQPFPAASQRVVDSRRRRRESALQDL